MARIKGSVLTGFEPCKLSNVELTEKKLGQGSYATVVEVKYMGLKCAGKIIHKDIVEQGDSSYIIQRFKEECCVLSSVQHSNIVQFLGVYFKEKEKVPILVMEFLPMNLTSCIEKHGILPEERGYSILHDVVLGLCYLHSQSPPIIHRDLSANNVLLTHNMDAKISDLGVARILNFSPLQVSLMKDTPGNLTYMPPEVMVANPKYDTSVDVFSIGVLMIHTMSGQWPVPAAQTQQGGRTMPSTEAERRKEFLQIIGNEHPLMKLILKCLDNNPKQRSHASEIKQTLSELVSQCAKRPSSGSDQGAEKATQEGSTSQTRGLRPCSGIPQRTKGVTKALSYQHKICSLETSKVSQTTVKSRKVTHLRKRFQPQNPKMARNWTGSLGRAQHKVYKLHREEEEEYGTRLSKSDDEGYTSEINQEINQEIPNREEKVGSVNQLRKMFQSSDPNQKVEKASLETITRNLPKSPQNGTVPRTKTKFHIQKQPTKFQVQKYPTFRCDEKSAEQSKKSFPSLSLQHESYTCREKLVSPEANDVKKVGKVTDLRKVFQNCEGNSKVNHPVTTNPGKALHIPKQFQSCERKGTTGTTGKNKATSSTEKVSTIPKIQRSFHQPSRKLWTKSTTPEKMPMNGSLRAMSTGHFRIKNHTAADNESTTESKIKVNGLSQEEEKSISTNSQRNLSSQKVGNVMQLRKGFEHQAEKHIQETTSPKKGNSSIPIVELEEWYFGNVECILASSKCKEDGDFLVRHSVGKKQYVITCRWEGFCRHYIIQEDGFGNYFNKSGVYHSVKELIDYHTENGAPLSNAGDILLHPVSKYDRWTLQQKDIKMEAKNLDGECFGEALNQLTGQKVTVKSYPGDKPKSINEFQLEAEVLKRCFHPNVIKLVGLCVDPSPKSARNLLHIVTEHMPEGDFLQFLKKRRRSISQKQLCRMCTDVCKGLEYIHTRLLRAHCDIRAKSCLVGEHEVVKVCNLGKSMCFYDRCEYKEISQTTKTSVRWTAPETMNGKMYLVSDVWSFGVLLWETFSEGEIPYRRLDNDAVSTKVKDGYHLDPPDHCPGEVSDIMLQCWKRDPNERPVFTTLLHKLQNALLAIKPHKTRV